jgi:predicted ferric reductase
VDVIAPPRGRAPAAGTRPRVTGLGHSLVLVALVGAGAVVFVWWHEGLPAAGPGARLIDAGRLTGLLAGYGAVVQLLLRARLGVVERGLGTDAINAAHRLFGGYLIGLVGAHLGLVTAGYARAARSSLADQVVSLLRDYPYVWWAALALGLLLVVGASSLPAVRRRLRYEVWHALHLLAYVALALAFFHQIANGEQLRHAGWVRTAWIALWIATAGALVAIRWVRPGWLSLRHRLVVGTVRREGADIVSVEVTGRHLDRFPAAAGQYFRWRFLCARRWHVAHPYSLSAEPDGRRLRFTATVTGRFSSSLPQLRPGTRVIAEGPCGGLLVPRGWAGPVVLIAGGVGVTPLRALWATCAGRSSTLIYRGHALARMPLRDEIDEIAALRGGTVHYLVGPRDVPENRLTPSRLESLCPGIQDSLVFVCGSGSFVRHVRASLSALGLPARQIRAESFELR